MLTKDLFDRAGEHLDGASRAGPGRWEEDHSRVRLPPGKTLRSERPEILHVVGYNGPVLGCGHLENRSVAPPGYVGSVYDRLDVVTAVPEQLRDPWGELLIEKSLHSRIARSPAAAASKPRWYSDSFSSIS